MDVHDVVKSVESSKEFAVFQKKNTDGYLVHVFLMLDANNHELYQVGYYSKNSDKITVFDVEDNTVIRVHPEEESFKEQNFINKLVIEAVTISKKDASKTASDVLKKNYSAESITKGIFLLQNLLEHGQIWNITLVTMTFHVVNVKINSTTGEVLSHTKESLITWKK